MGFPCAGIRMPSAICIIIILKILHCINFISGMFSKEQSLIESPEQELVLERSSLYEAPTEQQPSASLVPLPVSPSAASMNLQVVEFGTFLERLNREKDDYNFCSICLSGIEKSHEVRELGNCTHAFHRECLDSWVGEGHWTCPLCRAKLLWPGRETMESRSMDSRVE